MRQQTKRIVDIINNDNKEAPVRTRQERNPVVCRISVRSDKCEPELARALITATDPKCT